MKFYLFLFLAFVGCSAVPVEREVASASPAPSYCSSPANADKGACRSLDEDAIADLLSVCHFTKLGEICSLVR
jgi:hypothetical protein